MIHTSVHFRQVLKIAVAICLFVYSDKASAADCTQSDITLNTQTEVNNFQDTYGGGATCNTITGSLIIGYKTMAGTSNINDLSPLSDLQNVYKLEIYRTSLINLNGLSALTTVSEALNINKNNQLTSLDGLSSLTTVHGELRLDSNVSLNDISGLSTLVSVGENPPMVDYSWFVIGNSGLTDLTGLSSLRYAKFLIYNNALLTELTRPPAMTTMEELNVDFGNDSLKDLNGLSGLTQVNGNVHIWQTSLTSLQGLEDLESIGGAIYFYNNFDLIDISGLSKLKQTGGIYFNDTRLSNIDGLSSLASASFVTIKSNPNLAQINGLSALLSVSGNFRVYDNPSLSGCGLLATLLDQYDDGEAGPGPGVAGIPDIGNDVFISNNAPGCNSIEDIIPHWTIGGSTTGLLGSGLILQNNGADDLAVSSDGEFTFLKKLPEGSTYQVSFKAQPASPKQTCTVSNASGTLSGANVTDVAVSCITDTFTVGGTVRGLTGTGLILQNNTGDNLEISADGEFTFASALTDLDGYSVTVFKQPELPSQTCSVSNGNGNLAGTNVTDIEVTCSTNTYSVGGAVTGLLTSGIILQLNDDELEGISSDRAYVFDTQLEDETAYNVVIITPPVDPDLVCKLQNSSGVISAGNVTNVDVVCGPPPPDLIFMHDFESAAEVN